MLALWSLATKTQSSCGCHSCLNTATKLARRTTIATGRKRLKVSDCFTACYSTILGSAVLLDAAVKENRNKEWDRRIAEVKSSIPGKASQISDPSPSLYKLESGNGKLQDVPTGTERELGSQRPYTPRTDSRSSIESTNQSIEKTGRRVLRQPRVRLVLNEKVPWHEKIDRTSQKTRVSQSNLTTGPRIRQVYHVPNDPWLEPVDRSARMRPESFQLRRDSRMSTKLSVLDVHLKQSIMAASTLRHAPRMEKTFKVPPNDDQSDERYPHREPTKDLHLEKLEGMIARLVARLLITVKTSPTVTGTDEHTPQIQKMQARIEALQCRHTQLPEYSWINDEVVREERQGLYGALVKLNNGWCPESNLELMVAKICYNLLICNAPPDIAVYNLLLEMFTNRKLPELGQVIVDSFLYESRFKPSSNTVRLMYLHYTEKGDSKGFEALQKRMNAVDGKDLRIKRRPVWLTHKNVVAKWIASKNVMWRGSFIHEIFEPSPAIHDTMMKGFIKLRAIQKSVGIANKQISDGNYISPDTLDEIATACVNTGFRGSKTKHFGSPHILVNILDQIMSNKVSPNVMYETADGRKAMYTLRQMAVSSNFYKKWQQWTEVAWEILTRRMGISYVADALCDYTKGIDCIKDDVDALGRKYTNSEKLDKCIPTPTPEKDVFQLFDQAANFDAPGNVEHILTQFDPEFIPESAELLMARIATKVADLELQLIRLQESMIHMSVTYVPRNVAVHRFIRYQKQNRSLGCFASNKVEGLTKELAVLSWIHASPRAEHYYRITFEQARSIRSQAVETIAQYRWRKKISQSYAHNSPKDLYTHNEICTTSFRRSSQKFVKGAPNSIDGAFGADLKRSARATGRTGNGIPPPTTTKFDVRQKGLIECLGRTSKSVRNGDPLLMKVEVRRRGVMGRGGRIKKEIRMKALQSLPTSESTSSPKPEVPVAVSIPRYTGSDPLLLPSPSNSHDSGAAFHNF